MIRDALLVLAAFFAFALSGCSSTPAPEPRTYDLGLEAPANALPPVRIGAVRAVAPFDEGDMQYRLAYRSGAEIAPYAGSRWAASPADLFRKQLQRAAGAGEAKCMLSVEIMEFSQVFASEKESAARIEMRAMLSPSALPKQFAVTEANAGADAVSGAAAMARAANRAVVEIGAWVAAQPACR
jgi:cholesterol transport system auxiliary component